MPQEDCDDEEIVSHPRLGRAWTTEVRNWAELASQRPGGVDWQIITCNFLRE